MSASSAGVAGDDHFQDTSSFMFSGLDKPELQAPPLRPPRILTGLVLAAHLSDL